MTDRFTTARNKWRTDLELAAWRATSPHQGSDTAARLMVTNTWIDGPFYRIISTEDDTWISETGIVVPANQAQAWELTGPARIEWLEQIKAAPSADCGNSLLEAVILDWNGSSDPDDAAEIPAIIGDTAWCGECESVVRVIAGDNDVPVYAAHDLRGRLLHPAQPV